MKKIMIAIGIVIAILIGIFHVVTIENSEHRTSRALTVISSVISAVVGGYAVWSSQNVSAKAADLSAKAISASVRPYIRVSIKRHDLDYHYGNSRHLSSRYSWPQHIVAENIGNATAHTLKFKITGTSTNYEKEIEHDSLAVGEKKVIVLELFTSEDRESQKAHYGDFRGFGQPNITVNCKDILDEEHDWYYEKVSSVFP